MRIRFRIFLLAAAPALLLGPALSGFAQTQPAQRPAPPPYSPGQRMLNDDLRSAAYGHYPGSTQSSPFSGQDRFAALDQVIRQAQAQNGNSNAEYLERQRRQAAAQAEAIRAAMLEPQARANPDAPDQSELLRNSKDRDFILRNFRTMYVDAHNAQYFGSDQMKAALGRNKEFQKLNIRIVDDPHVADVVLKVSYTFAWDYPFELRHQNTTYVLLAGKGEGPFSGPLGAADVARQFVKAAKRWREEKDKSNH